MPKYDRELIARMLETPAVFEDASRREQARLLREAENLEADARTVVREVPTPNWCSTCGKHRNDKAAIFCSNAIHQQNAAQGGGEK